MILKFLSLRNMYISKNLSRHWPAPFSIYMKMEICYLDCRLPNCDGIRRGTDQIQRSLSCSWTQKLRRLGDWCVSFWEVWVHIVLWGRGGWNHIILENRILENVSRGRWVMWLMSDQKHGLFWEGRGTPPYGLSFLTASLITPGQFPRCIRSWWKDTLRTWQDSCCRNWRGPWRLHLPDSSSNLCNRAKVSACCLKYVRVTQSSGTFKLLILNGVKQIKSFIPVPVLEKMVKQLQS